VGRCPICGKWVYKKKCCSYRCAGIAKRKIKPKKYCLVCEREIQSEYAQKYCSRKCMTEVQRKYRVCPICEKKFFGEGNTVCCSYKCAGKLRGEKQRKKKQKPCLICGEMTYNLKYCSNRCSGISKKRRKNRYCENCGTQINRERYGKEWEETRFCSVSCRNEAQRKYPPKPCVNCGKKMIGSFKPFSTSDTVGVSGLRDRKFCSVACYMAYTGPTTIEKKVCEWLDSRKISYVYQQPFGRYVVDFHLPEYGVVIEVDGAYWHSDEKQDPEKALKRERVLLGLGLIIVHVPESAVHSGRFVKFIMEALNVSYGKGTEDRAQILQ